MAKVWQHPFVNILKHVKVEEWKRSTKEGDVTTVMDKRLKCTVYRIRGSIPASNYIQLPKTSSQSLGLTGRYLYLLFRPIPGKHFVVHLDVTTEDGQVIRISFSNLFKEFKSTATWLQFPFICGAVKGSVYESTAQTARQDLVGPAPVGARWTCLLLDLHYILSMYLNRRYSHLKSVKLCSNLLVKNLFTSDLLFEPGVTFSEAKQAKLLFDRATPMPREMAFPVLKGENWHDSYDYIRFPSDGSKLPYDSIQKGCSSSAVHDVPAPETPTRQQPRSVTISKPIQDRVSLIQQITTPKTRPHRTPLLAKSIPEVRLRTSQTPEQMRAQETDEFDEEAAKEAPKAAHKATSEVWRAEDGGIHVYVQKENGVSIHRHSSSSEEISQAIYTKVDQPETFSGRKLSSSRLLPDPILNLKRIIGFGGCTFRWALWTKTGSAVVYPCHAVIVVMQIQTREQRFFLGHTDKVSALAFNGNCTLLASAQTGNLSMVRLWHFIEGSCLSMFKTNVHSVSSLSFSNSGAILCGIGKDKHGKTMVVVWNTAQASQRGEVVMLAKAHTDVDIQAMKIAFFDDTRMVSCGRDNIRLWRVRSGVLRSCPVKLGEYHAQEFTDLAFEEGYAPDREPDDRTLYVCSRNGHILEIDYKKMSIRNVRRLLPSQHQHAQRREKQTFNSGPGIAINSISISGTFCATGSEDGYLRLWPLDFSAVFLEAEHEGPVSSGIISPDGLKVLSTTSTGNLGYLDIPSHGFHTLMRSHADSILAFSVDVIRKQLATVSQDNTIRIWELASMQQLYDFTALDETPGAVAFHPLRQVFACGFSSGIVRIFNVAASALLVEHKQHRGSITGLAFSPDGDLLYSVCSQGSLALYNATERDFPVLRMLGNVASRDAELGPRALAVSSNGCLLAFVGPSEYTVTVMDAHSLDELLRIDISILDLHSASLDCALSVCFSPMHGSHLLVSTSANKILWLDTKTGRLVREVPQVHRTSCSSLAVSENGRFLLTAGDKVVKVWDYDMKKDINSQVFIGHSEPVQQVNFTPDQQGVISIGDAIFIWDFLAAAKEEILKADGSSSVFPEAGTGTEDRNRDSTFITSGMPRQSAPVPLLSSPPRLDISPIHPGGLDDLLSESGEEEGTAAKENGGAAAARDTEHSVIVIEHGANRGAVLVPQLAAAHRGSGDHSQPWTETKMKRERHVEPSIRPDSYRHFSARFKTSTLPKGFSSLLTCQEGLTLKAVIGYNGNGRGNMAWNPDTGFFAYTCGCVIVVEDLHSGAQQHWLGHPEEISTLAVTHDAQTLASASGQGNGSSRCQIRIWNVQNGSQKNLLYHYKTEVQVMEYSRDDRILATAGDYRDKTIALWSTTSYELLISSPFSEPIHEMAFNPMSADVFASVGPGAVSFWRIEQQGSGIKLKIHSASIPDEVGTAELTSLSYNSNSLLYCGTNTGRICVWDTKTSRCFMTWEADKGEIGALLCRENRLVSGSNTKRIRLWAVAAVQELRTKGSGARTSVVLLEHEMMLDGTIVSAAFDDAMDMGIVGTTAGTLWYINWAENTSIRLISGHKNKVNDVAFSPRESHCATCGEDGSVRVWMLASMELVVQFQVLNQSCLCLAWSPSSPSPSAVTNQHIVAGYSDGTIRVFSVARTEMEMKMHPHPCAVTAVTYSQDGDIILSGGKDGLMAISSPRSGMTIRVLSDHRGSPITVIQTTRKKLNDFGFEGRELWLAASSDQRESYVQPPSLAAFCPWERGTLLYVGFGLEKEILFYSLHQKKVLQKIPLLYFATSLSLSPTTHLAAIGSTERILQLIDCKSGTGQEYFGHNDAIHLSRVTPSGRLLFTAAYNEVLVWGIQS
ncbi:WD repeat-containing protein 90 isoform X2 [Rhinatrema bivittatum]|uniref:WD repeat-containing protein 90 isoform X2 n=1 Tax=Rhinatrema bivittatum TaxID=194408 RepID=UPI00112CDE8E|nr:WD repeat-containing protein 90 isoform X2 [Rhinatrema bivittatum]